MMRPAAVLLDCDGVLVDSEGLTNRLLVEDFARHGLHLSLDEVAAFSFGSTMVQIGQEARNRGADLPPDWVPLFYSKMFAAMAEQVEAIPGAPDLLAGLVRHAVPRAVASNGPVAKMEITLRRTGLYDHVAPHIYSAQDLNNPKPAPDIYLHAAARLGIAAGDCVVIEDSPSGARAAVAAGMDCIGFAAEGQGAALAPHCTIVCSDMAGVIAHLGL